MTPAERLQAIHALRAAAVVLGGLPALKRVRQPGAGSHPEARQTNQGIELYDKFFKLPKKNWKHVLLHELGHWFRQEHVSLMDITGWEPGDKFYDLFAAGNSEEGFAEAFAVFFINPNELTQRCAVRADEGPGSWP